MLKKLSANKVYFHSLGIKENPLVCLFCSGKSKEYNIKPNVCKFIGHIYVKPTDFL